MSWPCGCARATHRSSVARAAAWSASSLMRSCAMSCACVAACTDAVKCAHTHIEAGASLLVGLLRPIVATAFVV